jgi:hypothetical protein
MTTYAGDHGGCVYCDSLGHELAERGHRPGCRSQYANEPSRPPADRAHRKREEAKRLRVQADALEREADALECLKGSSI